MAQLQRGSALDDSGRARRLLLLLPFAPRLDAPHGGGRVAAQLVAELTRRHRVALVYFRGADEPPLDEVLRVRCEIVREVARPWSGRSFAARGVRNARLVAGLARFQPMWVTDWASSAYVECVGEVAREFQPDVIQVEYHVMGQYLQVLDNSAAPRVLTEYEPAAFAAPYLKRSHPLVNGLLHRLDRLAWRRFEPHVLRQVDAVVVFTQADQRAVERLAGSLRVVRIPFGTPLPERALDPIGQSPWRLLFVGSYSHAPNIQAALHLARTIFPAARARWPDLRLELVGKDPPSELRRLEDHSITVTGQVPDIRPHLDRAAVFVAPLASGGGMRVKVLEALAAGKAVVASRLAAEGLAVQDGEQLYIADTNDQFVDRIVTLIADPTRRAAMASSARTWACANLGWQRSIAAYERLYQSLLEGSRDAAS
jgi:glycosyltransferase involved in cell wall biosynthesis